MPTKKCRRGHEFATKQCNQCKNSSARKKYAKDKEWANMRRQKAREWERKNPDRKAAHKRKQKYGLTDDEYKAMLEEQKGFCKICKQQRKLYVDHRHEVCNGVRGLLCSKCNLGLGHFEDNAEYLLSAITYLNPFRKET